MPRTYLLFICVSVFSAAACAQNPLRHPSEAAEIRFDSSQPVLLYRVRIDSADLSSVAVEMRVRNAPDTFRVAMVTHPEFPSRISGCMHGTLPEKDPPHSVSPTRKAAGERRACTPETSLQA